MRQLFCFIVTKVLNYVTFSAYRSNSESPFTPHASKNRHSIEENCERTIIMVIICNFILLLFWSSHISSVFLIYLTSIFLIKRTGLPAATATGDTSLVTTHSTKRCPNNVMYRFCPSFLYLIITTISFTKRILF